MRVVSQMPSQTTKNDATGWIAAACVSAATLWALVFYLPYSFGYGSSAIPLSGMLWGLWNDYGDWQHGMLVPFIVAGLIYWKREALARIPIRGANWAIAPMLLALFLFWAGYKADIQYVGFVAIQLLAGSLALWFLGWAFFKAVLFPWAFLGFMWPFVFLENMIAFPLRKIMSMVSYHFLNLIGIATVKVGTAVVSAPDAAAGLAQGERFSVDIADPCSGIRSLFALTMITCVYGYLTLNETWKKWVLLALAVPLAVMGNFARILMLTFGTLTFGSEFAIGPIDNPSTYHMFAGFLVFGVALMGMVAMQQFLARNWRGANAPSLKGGGIVMRAANRSKPE
jgi:exosortase